jgi:hypothetical protein
LLIESEWKRFFITYSMAFNKQHARKGNLFQRPFKRVEVNKDTHFTQAIIYNHANAQKHQLCKILHNTGGHPGTLCCRHSPPIFAGKKYLTGLAAFNLL